MKKNVRFIQVVLSLLIFCIAYTAQAEDVESREDVKLIRKIQAEYGRFKDQGYELYGLTQQMSMYTVNPYDPEQSLRVCNNLDKDIVKLHKLVERLKRTLRRCQKLENQLRGMESVHVTSFLAIIDRNGGTLHNLRMAFQEMKAGIKAGTDLVKRGCDKIKKAHTENN